MREAEFTYVSIVEAYKRLLADHPGEALKIGDDCYAVMVGEEVRWAMIDSNGEVGTEVTYPFIEDFWVQECECWEGDVSGTETTFCVASPSYLKIAS